MSSPSSDPLWPRHFWEDVPESDRTPLREVLAELLGRGVLLGDEGSGRELFLLARDHYRQHVEDYLAPLALELIVDEDQSILQARPRTESCLLLGRFDKDESLILLTLWRLYDDEVSTGSQEAVIITVDQLWSTLRVFFDKISTPEKSQIESCLSRLRRHRLIRTLRPEGMTQTGEMQIEILPSLARVIPFEDLAAWQTRMEPYQSGKNPGDEAEGGTEDGTAVDGGDGTGGTPDSPAVSSPEPGAAGPEPVSPADSGEEELPWTGNGTAAEESDARAGVSDGKPPEAASAAPPPTVEAPAVSGRKSSSRAAGGPDPRRRGKAKASSPAPASGPESAEYSFEAHGQEEEAEDGGAGEEEGEEETRP